MTRRQLIEKISNLNTWKKGNQRAPHKPLLLLIALSNIHQNKDKLMLFSDIEKPFTKLLIEFGPQRKSYHPDAPFSRLPRDEIWELKNSQGVVDIEGRSFTQNSLKKDKISGGFTKDIFDLIASNKGLIEEVASIILNSHWPQTVHQDILDAMGLDIDAAFQEGVTQNKKRKRDPTFRSV